MPDFQDKIPISEFSYTNSLNNIDQMPIIQQDGADWDNFRTSLADVGLHINKDMEYVTELHTTSKKVIGAINEIVDGGASMDITTEITTPASVQTFSDGGDDIPLKSLNTEILPVQEGTGTPSPTNVRSISGKNSITIVDIQNNLFDNATAPILDRWYITSSVDNPKISKTTGQSALYYFACLPNTTYIIFAKSDDYVGISRCAWTDFDLTQITDNDSPYVYNQSRNEDNQVMVITTGATAAYIVIQYSRARVNDRDLNVQVGIGTTTTISLGQTVYGANHECVEGKGRVTKGAIKLNDLAWTLRTSGNNNPNGTKFNASGDFSMVKGSGIGEADIICNVAVEGNGNYSTSDNNTIWFSNSRTTMGWIWGNPNQGSTLTDLENFLNNNDVWVVFDLATETALTTTPAKIPTLSGVNNIYTNCGDIQSLEYFNNGADDFASLDELMSSDNYSTNERIVGKWIDGSPVYEKTVYSAGGVTGDFTITHNISNLDRVLSYTGTVNDAQYSTYGDKWVLPRMATPYIGIDSVTSTVIKVINPSAFSTRLVDWYITLRYTKT